MVPSRFDFPDLGFGIGLRSKHFNHVMGLLDRSQDLEVDWFEIVSENFMDCHGRPRYLLKRLAERVPIVMHGVSLSIGSSDPLNFEYLAQLKALADEIDVAWVSDHLCWTGVLDRNSHDLLPMPLNEQSLEHVIHRIRTVQDFMERPLILENPSSYLRFACDTLPEWTFLTQMAEGADCGLLLDVNNVYVSGYNLGYDVTHYLHALPAERVVQFHLAGHSHKGTHIIDTHDGPVIEPVWQLYQQARERIPHGSTLVEWDARLPDFQTLTEEVHKARKRCRLQAATN